MSRLLNDAQAEAIYSALCALNNTNARLGRVVFPDTSVVVRAELNGNIVVINMADPTYPAETWVDQQAFVEAYKLS